MKKQSSDSGTGSGTAGSTVGIFPAGRNRFGFTERRLCKRFRWNRKSSDGLVWNRRRFWLTEVVSVQAAEPAGVPLRRFVHQNSSVRKTDTTGFATSLPRKIFSKRLYFSLYYKYPFFHLERVRSTIHFTSLWARSLSLSPLFKHQKYHISLSLPTQSQIPLIETKRRSRSIPPWVHRESLLLLGLWKP
jgi:hypothetical protein